MACEEGDTTQHSVGGVWVTGRHSTHDLGDVAVAVLPHGDTGHIQPSFLDQRLAQPLQGGSFLESPVLQAMASVGARLSSAGPQALSTASTHYYCMCEGAVWGLLAQTGLKLPQR